MESIRPPQIALMSSTLLVLIIPPDFHSLYITGNLGSEIKERGSSLFFYRQFFADVGSIPRMDRTWTVWETVPTKKGDRLLF